MFHLPLSAQAFEQYCDLELFLKSLDITDDNDSWSYIWGGAQFSVSKAYNRLIGSHTVHPAFKWLWKTSCQQKHSLLLVVPSKQTKYERSSKKENALGFIHL
jgi:hypothetical protein